MDRKPTISSTQLNLVCFCRFCQSVVAVIAISRKNWLFVGGQRAGARAAVLASQVASCKNNLVEPWAYLKNVFTRLADDPTGDQLTELLPDVWLNKNPIHRWEIAEKRKTERDAKA